MSNLERPIKPKSPCLKECENRTITCKCTCEKYKKYEELYREYADLKIKYVDAYSDYSSYKAGLVHKARKRTRKKF